jgi:hypothetical protein
MIKYSYGRFYGDREYINQSAKRIAAEHGLRAKMAGSLFQSNYSDENIIVHLAGLLSESSWGTPYKFVRELLCIPNNMLLYKGANGNDQRPIYNEVPLKRVGNARFVTSVDSSQLIRHLNQGTEFQKLCAAVLTSIQAEYLEAVMGVV